MSEQKKAEEFGITEDDVSEIRQVGKCYLLIACSQVNTIASIGKELLLVFSQTHRISTSSVLS